MTEAIDLDHDNPGPQSTTDGPMYEATIRFSVPVAATREQIAEAIAYQLGGGSIDQANPVVDSEGLRRVECDHVNPLGYRVVTDWEAEDERRARRGRSRIVRDAQ